MSQEVAILNPEKTILTYRLAGLGVRIGAHILDVILVIAAVIGILVGIGLLGLIEPGLATAAALIVVQLGIFAYFILLEGLWNGQTLGKKAFRIRVRMADGMPITFGAAIGRNLLRPADFLPALYFAGIVAMFTNQKSQRIGDLFANTIVCYEERPNPIMATAPHVVGIHPLESAVGDLRGMTIEEYNALRRYCDRFPELPFDIQNRLTEEVWGPIAVRRLVPTLQNVHPIYLAEAVVMKYGRQHGLL